MAGELHTVKYDISISPKGLGTLTEEMLGDDGTRSEKTFVFRDDCWPDGIFFARFDPRQYRDGGYVVLHLFDPKYANSARQRIGEILGRQIFMQELE